MNVRELILALQDMPMEAEVLNYTVSYTDGAWWCTPTKLEMQDDACILNSWADVKHTGDY